MRIPPTAHTYRSDVETVHRLVEDEFFDLETFTSRSDFLAKATTYQLYFNRVRPNSHKDKFNPWQVIERLAPHSPLELCLLPPVFLDYYINDSGGYDLPRLPCHTYVVDTYNLKDEDKTLLLTTSSVPSVSITPRAMKPSRKSRT